jgi:D-glycero-D-manno-heptose 1,7-bisphosphate phosphatase
MNRAVFLDRDGTLMEEVHYCADPGLVKLFPGVPAALQRLKDAGFRNIIITNQSGIGRGLLTEAHYQSVQAELLRQIGPNLIDATYYCPDTPEVPSLRRKPNPGMVLEAAAEYDIDLAESYFIGDKIADIQCGQRAGTRTILVSTGYGKDQVCAPDFRAKDLAEAVKFVLEL